MKTILSIDDDPKILRCLESTLKDKGYTIFTTTDPSELTKLLKDHDIDLIMLDVRMPQKDGFEIFKELKQNNRHLPALFITAYPASFSVESDDMIKMWQNEFADGITDILYKPFEIETLYEKVEALIGPGKES